MPAAEAGSTIRHEVTYDTSGLKLGCFNLTAPIKICILQKINTLCEYPQIYLDIPLQEFYGHTRVGSFRTDNPGEGSTCLDRTRS